MSVAAAGDLLAGDVFDPPADPAALERLAARLAGAGVAVERDRPLGPLTTLGVGGPARLFATPPDRSGLARLLAAAGAPRAGAGERVPLLVVGKGSNLLVSDAGFPGLAVRLGAGFKAIGRDGPVVSAGGAAAMPAVTAWAARAGLSGLEFGAGVPGTVGGCVRMNAGAHGGETADLLREVEVETWSGPGRLTRAELDPGYRRASLPAGAVVVAASWTLRPDDPVRIRSRLDELRGWRRATQPLRQRNCGSVFTNPPGDSAARLIEAAGLKGRRIGAAAVSTRHANFIVVDPPCPAADVYALIALLQRSVRDAGGPLLVPEVRLVGRFAPAGGAARTASDGTASDRADTPPRP